MIIEVRTKVHKPANLVFERFNRELFETLNPWWNIMKIKRFDGIVENGLAVLEVGPFRQEFRTVIKDIGESHFVDIGIKLPFPFIKWKHTHLIDAIDNDCIITDHVSFDVVPVLRPVIWLYVKAMFTYRRKKYIKFFS